MEVICHCHSEKKTRVVVRGWVVVVGLLGNAAKQSEQLKILLEVGAYLCVSVLYMAV